MMEIFTAYIPRLIGGYLLGLFYFGGLWLTCRQLPHSGRPVLLFFGSFLGRTAVVLIVLVLLMGGRWELLLTALGGFLLARLTLVGWTKKQLNLQAADIKEKIFDGNQSG